MPSPREAGLVRCPRLATGKPGEIPPAVCRATGQALVIPTEAKNHTWIFSLKKEVTPEMIARGSLCPVADITTIHCQIQPDKKQEVIDKTGG